MLGWPQDVDDDGDVVLHAPPGAGPNWIFLAVPDEKVVKNRIHLDFRPDDQQAEVDRVIGLGARHVDIGQRATRAGSCWPIRRATNSASSPPRLTRLLTPPPRGPTRMQGTCVSAPRHAANHSILRTVAAALLLSLAACGSPEPAPQPGPAADVVATSNRSGGHRHGRRVVARRADAHAVRRVPSDRRLAGSRTAQSDSGRCPKGGHGGHRHPDHLGLALEGISAAASR